MIPETRGTFKREFAGTTYFPPLPQIIIRLEAPRPPVLGPVQQTVCGCSCLCGEGGHHTGDVSPGGGGGALGNRPREGDQPAGGGGGAAVRDTPWKEAGAAGAGRGRSRAGTQPQ